MLGLFLMAANNSLLNQALNGATFTVSDLGFDPADSTASASVNSAGTITWAGNLSAPATQTWLLAGGVNTNYEVQATTGGTVSTGTLDSYLATTSNRAWTKTQSGFGSASVTLAVTIRHTTSTSDSVAFTVELSADVSVI